MKLLITASFLTQLALAAYTKYPPRTPASYPGIDQTVMISGALLTDPMIVDALVHVKATVPAALLNIKPSTYQTATPNAPLYTDNAAANCYWPSASCLRTADTPNFKADISSCPNTGDWGLTYDDGPTVSATGGTPQLLAALKTKNVKATFYVTGSNSFQNGAVLKDIDAAGHQIALHTWTHHPLTSLTNEQVIAELLYNEAIVFKETGKAPIHMRPPYGDADDRVRAIVDALGFRLDYWTVDSGDANFAAETAANALIAQTAIKSWYAASGPGIISLQHDISPFTVNIAIPAINALPAVLPMKPMPVGQCLGMDQAKWYKNDPAIVPPSISPPSKIVPPSTPTKDANSKPEKAANSSAVNSLSNIKSILFTIIVLVISFKVLVF